MSVVVVVDPRGVTYVDLHLTVNVNTVVHLVSECVDDAADTHLALQKELLREGVVVIRIDG